MSLKPFIFLFAFIFLISFVSAVPPVQTTVASSTTGLEVFYPGIDITKAGDSFDVNVHVFNLSNGYPIRNATCYLHTYNRTGDHTHSSIMIQDPVEDHKIFNEWVTRLNGANFTSLGEHSMVIQCNNSLVGGATKFTLMVTPTGDELTPGRGVILGSILMSIVTLIFVFMVLSTKFAEKKDYWYMSVFFFAVSMVLTLYAIHLGYIYHQDFTNYVSGMGSQWVIYLIVMYTTAIFCILAFIVWFIKTVLKALKTGSSDKVDMDVLPEP